MIAYHTIRAFSSLDVGAATATARIVGAGEHVDRITRGDRELTAVEELGVADREMDVLLLLFGAPFSLH